MTRLMWSNTSFRPLTSLLVIALIVPVVLADTGIKQSQESTKLDARQAQFVTKLPKNGTAIVSYRVRYTW